MVGTSPNRRPRHARVRKCDATDVVGGFYSAACGERSWADALRLLCESGLGHSAHLYGLSASKSIAFQESFRVADDGIHDWTTHWVHHCPRLQYLSKHPGLPVYYDFQFTDERSIRRSGYYDWLVGLGSGPYFLGAVLNQDNGEQMLLSVHRTSRMGHVDSSDLALFGRVREHLSQALRIARQFGDLQGRAASLHALAAATEQATLVLGDDGRVEFMNDAAETLLRTHGGLRIVDGCLQALDSRANAELTRAVAAALAQETSTMAQRVVMQVPGAGHNAALKLRILPLRPQAPAKRIAAQQVGVFLSPVAATADERLQVAGLTAAERRLVALLASGEPLKRAATQLGITYSTARLHLAHAMRKTRTHRQVDLVRLALDERGL